MDHRLCKTGAGLMARAITISCFLSLSLPCRLLPPHSTPTINAIEFLHYEDRYLVTIPIGFLVCVITYVLRLQFHCLGPIQRVNLILKEEEYKKEYLDRRVFTEVLQYDYSNEWKQLGRWIRFEEKVEESGARWSKPHVSTLELQAVFSYRHHLREGYINLNEDAKNFNTLITNLTKAMLESGALQEMNEAKFEIVMRSRRMHQFSMHFSPGRSLAKISRGWSDEKLLDSANGRWSHAELSSRGSETDFDDQDNKALLKKLPHGAEGFAIFIAEVDWLDEPLSAFVRLTYPDAFRDVLEVKIPVRFLFVLIGRRGHIPSYVEIGRSAATMMSDESFRIVAYKATQREHILDGIEEFLSRTIILPPGEWDERIRIEPPAQKPGYGAGALPKPGLDAEVHGHGADPALQYTKRPFGGLIADIKRRAPWYRSDITDGFHLQTLSSFLYMYFALIPNCVTFGGMMQIATQNHIGTVETLLGNAIAGLLFTWFSGQPMNVLGPTGPMMIFETIVYTVCESWNLNYLSFRFWIGMWSALYMFILVATDASFLVSLITRFTEESFAFLVAIVFIYKAFEKVLHISHSHFQVLIQPLLNDTTTTCICQPTGNQTTTAVEKLKAIVMKNDMGKFEDQPWVLGISQNDTVNIDWSQVALNHCKHLKGQLIGDACYEVHDIFWFSLVLMVGTYSLVNYLRTSRSSSFFPSTVRRLFADFSTIIAIAIMTGVDILIGINTPKLTVPETFAPTDSTIRGWVVDPFADKEIWPYFAASAPALLATILMFMDQHITAVIVNRKENKLKKGAGYHLDLLIITITVIICTILGLPWQVAATVLAITNIDSLKKESDCTAPGEKPTFVGCREQRVSLTLVFLLLGTSILMGKVLKYIPMPVLYGVFLYMGLAALGGLQLIDRLKLLLMPVKYQPDHTYLRHVSLKRVHLFTLVQVLCLAALLAIKTVSITAIMFPLMLVAMVVVRKLAEYIFTPLELQYLDDILPEFKRKKQDDGKEEAGMGGPGTQLRVVESQGTIKVPLHSGNVLSIPRKPISDNDEDGYELSKRKKSFKDENSVETPLLPPARSKYTINDDIMVY